MPDAKIHFYRLTVNEDQIGFWEPTRPTKTTDSVSKNFGEISVELDAMHLHVLRTLMRAAIEQ